MASKAVSSCFLGGFSGLADARIWISDHYAAKRRELLYTNSGLLAPPPSPSHWPRAQSFEDRCNGKGGNNPPALYHTAAGYLSKLFLSSHTLKNLISITKTSSIHPLLTSAFQMIPKVDAKALKTGLPLEALVSLAMQDSINHSGRYLTGWSTITC